MNATIVTMLINLSKSLQAVERLIFGAAYVCGIFLVVGALWKWYELVSSRGEAGEGQTSLLVMMLLSGIGLIYMPSWMEVLSATAFGTEQSLLQYSNYNPYNLYSAMNTLIQTVGVLWFFWGMILLAQSGHPNAPGGMRSPGARAFGYVLAGIFAMNFSTTVGMMKTAIELLMQWF